jgi:hypothetical protein
MIDSSIIEQIREASDLVALISETVDLKPSGSEFRGLCPFHEDHHPSLSVNPEKQRWFCHPCQKGGDVIAFVRERDGLGFPDAVRELGRRAGIGLDRESDARGTRGRPGVTVAEWVRAKRLDPDLVRALNISDTIWKDSPAVSFRYYMSGYDPAPVAVHIRRTLEQEPNIPRFEWRKGDSPVPYGLWCLSTSGAREGGLIHLVEGESDFISLLQQDIPALGVPGNHWREDWSRYLEGIAKILVAVEPDNGGERLVESLAKSSLWPRCSMPGIIAARGNNGIAISGINWAAEIDNQLMFGGDYLSLLANAIDRTVSWEEAAFGRPFGFLLIAAM